MRRKPGSLVPLELAICEAAAVARADGYDEFHGYEIAKTIGDAASRRLLTAYGTLDGALGRLEKMGLLQSRWEDPAIPARENRPGRCLYTLTALGDAPRAAGWRPHERHTRRSARDRPRLDAPSTPRGWIAHDEHERGRMLRGQGFAGRSLHDPCRAQRLPAAFTAGSAAGSNRGRRCSWPIARSPTTSFQSARPRTASAAAR